ncbi:MAG: macro domain-containing protein, partial [Armatimonadota bacterium]
ANSFGDMSGGIDKAIDDFYEGRAQEAVMAAIRDRFLGELPVGMALIIPLTGPRFPFLVAAPTMRVPASVGQTINAYLSLRAVLVAVLQHNREYPTPIRSLAVPGLCTGVGGMDFGIAARQMRSAFDNVIGGGWKDVVHPAQAPYALGPTARMGWSWNRPGKSEEGTGS